MTRPKNRNIRLRIRARYPQDPLKYLKAIEEVFRPKELDIELQEEPASSDKTDETPLFTIPDEQLEQKFVDKARNHLDELAKKAERSKRGKKQKKTSKTRQKVASKRKRIRAWLRSIAKEGYRITVKSFFDALLDKSKPM